MSFVRKRQYHGVNVIRDISEYIHINEQRKEPFNVIGYNISSIICLLKFKKYMVN